MARDAVLNIVFGMYNFGKKHYVIGTGPAVKQGLTLWTVRLLQINRENSRNGLVKLNMVAGTLLLLCCVVVAYSYRVELHDWFYNIRPFSYEVVSYEDRRNFPGFDLLYMESVDKGDSKWLEIRIEGEPIGLFGDNVLYCMNRTEYENAIHRLPVGSTGSLKMKLDQNGLGHPNEVMAAYITRVLCDNR